MKTFDEIKTFSDITCIEDIPKIASKRDLFRLMELLAQGLEEIQHDWDEALEPVKSHNALKKLYRIDDGRELTKNDDGTYTFTHQFETMPTTFYRYTLEELMRTGRFEFR